MLWFFSLFVDLVVCYFLCEEVVVINGDVEVVQVFFVLLFDYLFFIGFIVVGCYVMCVVLVNFMLVMLELGGKLFVIIGLNVDFLKVVECIVFGKLVNVGQICIVLDYVLLLCNCVGDFISVVCVVVVCFYFDIVGNGQYVSIIFDCQYEWLCVLCDQVIIVGVCVEVLGNGSDFKQLW